MGTTCRFFAQERPDYRSDETLPRFVWSIKEKEPSPRGAQFLLFAKGCKQYLKSMFALAIGGGRLERSGQLRTMPVAPVILGAGADTDHSLPALVGKSLQQMLTGLNPTKVFRGGPILSRHGIPCAMQQVRRSGAGQQSRDLPAIQKIGLMPAHCRRRCRRLSSRRHRMYLIASSREGRQTM